MSKKFISEKFERNYEWPTECPECGGTSSVCRVIGWPDNNLQVRHVCLDCGYSYAVMATENLNKKQNVMYRRWHDTVLAINENACRLCGATENLETHHIIPREADSKNVYAYNPGNGIVLCKRCHALIHFLYGPVRRVVSEYIYVEDPE